MLLIKEHMVSFSNGNLLAVVLALTTEKRSKYTATAHAYDKGDPLLLSIKLMVTYEDSCSFHQVT